MSSPYILKYGSEILKEKYLPGIISGELIGCIGITEPDTGSDVKNIKTRAEDKGDYFLINGSKTFITNGMYGDFVVTVVKTDSNIGAKGISLVVIDLNSKGINRTKINKLGWHSSDTAEISFDNVKVPKENLVGEKGKGFYYLMNGLQLERLIFVPSCIGAMEYAMSESIKYMKQRKSFGKTIDQFQNDESWMLTSAGRFSEKAEMFPNSVFIIGADTLMRVFDEKFYKSYKDMMEHIQRFNDHNINFLVFGRKVAKKFISLKDINVPELIKDRCTGIEEDSFRDDISSTELRLTKN